MTNPTHPTHPTPYTPGYNAEVDKHMRDILVDISLQPHTYIASTKPHEWFIAIACLMQQSRITMINTNVELVDETANIIVLAEQQAGPALLEHRMREARRNFIGWFKYETHLAAKPQPQPQPNPTGGT